MNLVLGTAQLGMHYGIANKTGQPDQAMATEIINEAWKNGIREFDTAQGYGISEQVLGQALSVLGLSNEVLITSKFDPFLDHLDTNILSKALDESLSRLGVPYLFCVMLHREEMLSLWDKGLSQILRDFVLSDRVKHLGVSVYTPEKAIQALNTNCIDIIQLPTNILDRRFETAGVFQLANEKSKQIYIRSIFLQGLILMDTNDISEKMSFAKPVIEKLESISREMQLSRKELALAYIKSEMPNAKVIFGVDTPQQVKENLLCWERTLSPTLISRIKNLLNNINKKVLNPALWPI